MIEKRDWRKDVGGWIEAQTAKEYYCYLRDKYMGRAYESQLDQEDLTFMVRHDLKELNPDDYSWDKEKQFLIRYAQGCYE